MRRLHGQHVQPPQQILHMHDRRERDLHRIARRQQTTMHAEHYIQMLIAVAQQYFIKAVFKHRENAHSLAWLVGAARLARIYLAQCAQILEPHHLHYCVARRHREICPAGRALSCD